MAQEVPEAIKSWIDKTYIKPRVDPEWLRDCYVWLTTEQNLTDIEVLKENIDIQLMSSDLRDSMRHGTGLPVHIAQETITTTLAPGRSPSVLVQIMSIMEIGNSAWNLDQVRFTREERLAGRAAVNENVDDNPEQEDEGPVPKYPRSMLKLELTDGATVLPAIEYGSMPDLELGTTPLGTKMMLKNVTIRRGIAFLTPGCASIKGGVIEELEVFQRAQFARSLRARMGLPPLPEDGQSDETAANATQQQQQQPQPQQDAGGPVAQIRSPLRDISLPPSPPPVDSAHLEDEAQPKRRRVPESRSNDDGAANQGGSNQSRPIRPLPGTKPRPMSATSPYFNQGHCAVDIPPTLSPTRAITSLTSVHNDAPQRPRPALMDSDVDVDDFDDGLDVDDAFLDSLDQVEAQILGSATQITTVDSANGTTSTVQQLAPSSSTVPNSQAPLVVIDIDDDESEVDKENVRIQSTRKRPRRANINFQISGEVIDISDSD